MNYPDEGGSELPEFPDNPDPSCPCILLLDTSGSMNGAPLQALNQGLKTFQTDIQQDDLARRRVEVAIVTFGNGGVQIIQDFVKAGQFQAPTLSAGGDTPMGKAINRALDMLRDRKAMYNANAIPSYRPWIFMITDGAPTDEWQTAARRVYDEEAAKGMAFFAVGVAGANMQTLVQIAVRKPVMLQGLKFTEMFLWLSRSQQLVSASKLGEQTALPSIDDWASV